MISKEKEDFWLLAHLRGFICLIVFDTVSLIYVDLYQLKPCEEKQISVSDSLLNY